MKTPLLITLLTPMLHPTSIRQYGSMTAFAFT